MYMVTASQFNVVNPFLPGTSYAGCSMVLMTLSIIQFQSRTLLCLRRLHQGSFLAAAARLDLKIRPLPARPSSKIALLQPVAQCQVATKAVGSNDINGTTASWNSTEIAFHRLLDQQLCREHIGCFLPS